MKEEEVSDVAQGFITKNVSVVILGDLMHFCSTVNSQGPYNKAFLFIVINIRYILYIFYKTGAL